MTITLPLVGFVPVLTSDSPYPIRTCQYEDSLLVGYDPAVFNRDQVAAIIRIIVGDFIDIDWPEMGDRA